MGHQSTDGLHKEKALCESALEATKKEGRFSHFFDLRLSKP